MSVSPWGFLSVVLWFSPLMVWADDVASAPRQTARMVSSADVLQWLLALIVVLMVFIVSAWLLRKTGSSAFTSRGQLAVLAGLPLGMREKLVLIKVGEKQLLLAVSHGRIDKLLELDGDDRLFVGDDQTQDLGAFAKKLMKVMQGKVHD